MVLAFRNSDISKGNKELIYRRKILKSEGDKRSERRINRYLNSKRTDQFIFLN